jgi:hypothetical protein
MPDPVRLQLSRRKGFNLQTLSLATNGLPAVKVARPGFWGNPFTVERAIQSGYATVDTAQAFVVECFSDWLRPLPAPQRDWWQGPESDARKAAILGHLQNLRGKNLACWCKPGAPCHADALLELANRPVCEAVD